MRILDVGVDSLGTEALKDAVEKARDEKFSPILLSVNGDRMESGCSWGVDCVEAGKIIDMAAKLKDSGMLIKVAVGDKQQWESVVMLNYEIKTIPTLINHTTGWKLEGEQCCNELLVKRMIGVKVVIQPKQPVPPPSDVQFKDWLSNLEDKFSSLSNNEKKIVSIALHSMCAPFKSKELASTLDRLSKRDFLVLLPPEVSCMILGYLNHATLIRCAAVSHRWKYFITTNDKFWMKALSTLEMHEPLLHKKLRFMSPYKLFCNYKRKVTYFTKMGAELHCPYMEEIGRSDDLGHLKDLQASADGHLVIGYTMQQPHNIYHKYQVTDVSSTKILSTIKTIRSMDCRVNDRFLFCSTNSGRWVCYSWKTTRELYSIQTYDYGFDEHNFPAFAEACDHCPILAVFDTNRTQFNPDGVNHTTIKFLAPFVNEHSMLEFGVRLARFKLHSTPEYNIIAQQAIMSSGIKFHHGHERSEYMPCEKHRMIFQQQNFKIYIYEVNTHHRAGPCSMLFPVLIRVLHPTTELDMALEPFDPIRYRLSRDKAIIAYTSGSQFCWSTMDGTWNRHTTIEGNPYLTTVAVGSVFSMLAVVTTEFYRPILVETGSGNIVKIFPDLTPIQGTEPRRYSFLATFLHMDWLDDVPDSPELNRKALSVGAAAYREGFGVWHLIP